MIDFLKTNDGSYLYPITLTSAVYDLNGKNLEEILAGKQAVGNYALSSHNHDSVYSKLDHTHTIANISGLQNALDGKQAAGSYAAASHTHNYAGSSSVGGSANSAVKLSATKKIIFSGLSGTEVSTDFSSDITITDWGYRCSAGSTIQTNNYPYHAFAKTGKLTGSFTDKSGIFLIDASFDGGGFGIFKVSLRTNNQVSGSYTASNISIKWLARINLNIDAIQAGIHTELSNTYAYIFYKSTGGWNVVNIRALDMGGRNFRERGWILQDSLEKSTDASNIPNSYTSIAAMDSSLSIVTPTDIVTSTHFSQNGVRGETVRKASTAPSNTDMYWAW